MKMRFPQRETKPWELELRLKLLNQVAGFAGMVLVLVVVLLVSTNEESENVRLAIWVLLPCLILYGAVAILARYRTRLEIDAKGVRLKRLRGVEFDLSWDEVEGFSQHDITGKMMREHHRFDFLVLKKKDGPVITVMDQGWTPNLETGAACMNTHMLARKTK